MRLILATAVLVLGASGAFAATPEGAKLSEIITKIEQVDNFHYIDEIDWDNGDGYYKIEYYLKDGSEVEVRIDPKTGNNVK